MRAAGAWGAWLSIGRAHIVAIAALGCFTFGWLLTGRRPWAVALVCGLDWLLVNLLNRAVDLVEDRANRIPGTEIVAAGRRRLVPAAFALLAGSLAALAPVWPALLPWRIGYHLLGLAYNYPLRPGRRRLKQLYFWKNLASATGFLITLFAYPLAAAGRGTLVLRPAAVATLALFFLLFELSYEVIYDLRDVDGDRAAGVRSYPAVHGERGAARIVDALIAASAAVLAAGYAGGLLAWRHFIMVCAPAIQMAWYRRALGRGVTTRDCVGLTWLGAGLLAAYNLWIALGLPGA